jgi:HEAT repeat protein
VNRETLIDKLKVDLAAGRVVTIVGTGVSVAACKNQEVEGLKVATWTGLLLHAVKHCKDIGAADKVDVKLLTNQIKSGKTNFLISAAEDVSLRMQSKAPGVFRGWLKDTIGKLEIRDRAVIDAVGALPGILATLNYDNLLVDGLNRRAVTWLKPNDVQDVLTGMDTDAVLHLHGWYKEPDSVVLGLGSYLAVKDHPHAKAVLNLLTMDRTMLFVGCGDTVLDPNFARLIEWGKEALNDVAPRHYMLCRTSEIAAFQAKLTSAPWLQPLDYGATHADLVPFLRGLVSDNGTRSRRRPAPGPSFDLAAYQSAMRKSYSRLKLEELDPTTHDVLPLTLTGMFIPQTARECAQYLPRVLELPKELQQRLRENGDIEFTEQDEELIKELRETYLSQSPRPISEILCDPALDRLVVLGDPGSGKSTLLQFQLLQWAERADAGRYPLPLLVELREYARCRQERGADGFLGYLHQGAGVRWHLNQAELDDWLRNNPSLMMFDGLDEVFDPVMRREVVTAIHRFADEHPLARIVVTSRVIGFQSQIWSDQEFRRFMLEELDDSQIAEFLNKWHRGAYETASRGEAKRSLLERAIRDSTAIRQLAGNPLLLTMMAILNRTQDLPRDRAELYEQCARLLLHQWKVDLAFEADPELSKASLDFKDKRALMMLVASVMQSSDHGLAGNLIDERTLELTLTDGLKAVPDIRPDRAARALIEQLRGLNFMLCSIGGNNYAFVHRTFLEYFCAAEIYKRFSDQLIDTEQLKAISYRHWPDETWHEVLCLLAGMLPPKVVAEILEWLLTQTDVEESCRNVFLAARCVGEVRKRDELGVVAASVLSRTKELVCFDFQYFYTLFDSEYLAAANIRTRSVRVLASVWPIHETRNCLKAFVVESEYYDVRQTAVEELAHRWKDDPETLKWLKFRAIDDNRGDVRQTAILELACGWKDDPETLTILKSRAIDDDHTSVRQTAILELACGWKDDPETLTILKSRAIGDENRYVRLTAVRQLARGWKSDPETFAILKSHAIKDYDFEVCEAAVVGLARGWKDDPQTLKWLKSLAVNIKGGHERQTAIVELARGWKDDPETLAILKSHAIKDEDVNLRRTAIEELARGWKDDPETLTILKSRAIDDDHTFVRQTAIEEVARGWKDDFKTLSWLKSRVIDETRGDVRQTAVEELARGWKDDPETLTILKSHVTKDEYSAVRRSAVVELARGWKDDPETLTILKSRAVDDEHSGVRQAAVNELARGWNDDPETLTILKSRAIGDENPYVRQTAVRGLARGWKSDPETFAILKSHAMNDESPGVRTTAMGELARGWKSDPETFAILKSHAMNDKDPIARESAISELVRGWKYNPETLTILKSRAADDESYWVSGFAALRLARDWKGSAEVEEFLANLKPS